MRWIDAMQRSNEEKAALVIKKGSLTVGTIITEFYGDDGLKVSVNRGGREWEHYFCDTKPHIAGFKRGIEYEPSDFVLLLHRLAPNALALGNSWEPV